MTGADAAAIASAVSLAILGFAVVYVAWAVAGLVRSAAGATPAVTVAVLLAGVTGGAIIAAAITGSETMGTIAATGVGGLAGAVTAAYRADRQEDD